MAADPREKTPLLLNRVASLTAIRDLDIFEFSFLKTLADMLKVREICLYKFNDINEPCRLIRYCNEAESTDDKYSTDEFKEIQVGNIVIPDEIKQAGRWISATNKPYFGNKEDELLMVYPVVGLNSTVGYLAININHQPSETENLVISSLLSISHNFHNLLEENQKDKLTGLLNRKTFDENISKIQYILNSTPEKQAYTGEDKRKENECSEYWLSIIDIDSFKDINDSHGHVYGDEVLLLLSQVMKETFRPRDLLFRFGGEEFVAIIKVKNQEAAQKVFERFRTVIEEFKFPQVGQITISLGATLIDEEYTTPSDIVGRADEATYHAKNNGKNKLFFYEDLLSEGIVNQGVEDGEIRFF